jgi:hypothetical protein
VKWIEGLRRNTDHMKFNCFFYILLVLSCFTIYGSMFCMLLFNFVYYEFLLLVRSVLGIVFHCVVLCIVCV